MSFRLVPKSVTLNDLERRNGRYIALLWSPYVIGQTIIFLPCDFYLSFFLLFFLA